MPRKLRRHRLVRFAILLVLAAALVASGRAQHAEALALVLADPGGVPAPAASVEPVARQTVSAGGFLRSATGVEWVDGGDDSPCLNDDNGRALTSLPSEKWCTPIVGCYQDDAGKYVYPSRKTGIWQGDPSEVRYADEATTTVKPSKPSTPTTTRPTPTPTTPPPATTAPQSPRTSNSQGSSSPTPAEGTPDPENPGATLPADPEGSPGGEEAATEDDTTTTTEATSEDEEQGASDGDTEVAAASQQADGGSGAEAASGPIDLTSGDGSGSGSGPSIAGLVLLVGIVGAATGGVVWMRRRSQATSDLGGVET